MRKIAQLCFLCLIYFVPFASIFEVATLFSASRPSLVSIASPLWWKLLKDGLVLIVILLSLASSGKPVTMSIASWFATLGIGISIVISILASIGQVELLVLFAGLRWLLPLALLWSIALIVDDDFLASVYHALTIIFMLHFAFQVVQLFTMSHFYGLQLGGLAARTPGLFLVPNSAAFFSTFFLFLALYGEERQKTFSVVMALASVFLTQSGTGIVICVILIYLKAVPKKFTPVLPWFLFSGCVGVILMFFAFSPALGRGSDYIAVSGGTRLRIFLDALARSNFLSYTFGAGTNSSQLLGFTEFAVDSIYASIVINLGWGALLIILIIAAITIFKNRKRKRNTAFMLMYGLFGATTIFLEAFPMNYLFSLMAVVYFGRKKSRFEIKFVERRQAARMAIFSKQANKDYKWNP